MPLPATILIYGHDPLLLDTRRWVLEKAGFQVLNVAEPEKVAEIMTGQPIELLLLCQSLTAAERRAALSTAIAAVPPIKRLVMTTNGQEAGQEETEGETLHLFAGAAGLIDAAQKLLS